MIIYCRSHSWTNFGVSSIRELVWDSLAHMEQYTHMGVELEIDSDGESKQVQVQVVTNPCLFKSYTEVYNGLTHIGSGNATECSGVVKSILWKHHSSEDESDLRHVCHYEQLDSEGGGGGGGEAVLQFNNEGVFENIIDSIHVEDGEMEVVHLEGEGDVDGEKENAGIEIHDSISSSDTVEVPVPDTTPHRVPCPLNNIQLHLPLAEEFYAMSVYYFAFDCVRTLGPVDLPSWPTPSVLEL